LEDQEAPHNTHFKFISNRKESARTFLNAGGGCLYIPVKYIHAHRRNIEHTALFFGILKKRNQTPWKKTTRT
jgi:hypothetical protein